MARLVYGGVEIQILKTHLIDTRDEYDETGLDYLWTRWTFDVTGAVNLDATSYQSPVDVPNPQAAQGVAPFGTIAVIHDTLSQPRQILQYFDETGNVLLQSPTFAPAQAPIFNQGAGAAANIVRVGGNIVNNIDGGGNLFNGQVVGGFVPLDCDCTGGPKPLQPVQILRVDGVGKTVLVRFVIETTVNDSIYWTGQGGINVVAAGGQGFVRPKPPVILSNRWRTSETLDEAAFSTRTYEGRAVFRADLLRDLVLQPGVDNRGVNLPNRLMVPDDFRSYWGNFFVPDGFQRQQVWVEEEPSGFAVRYRITDVQLPVTLISPSQGKTPAAYKLEAIQILGVDVKGAEQALWELGFFTLDNVTGILSNVTIDPVKDLAELAAGALRQARMMIGTGVSLLPESTDIYIITAYGQPGSSRQRLANLAYTVLFNYFTGDDAFWATSSVRLTLDLMGKWVRLVATVKRGPVRSAIVNGVLGKAIIDLRNRIPANDGIPGVTSNTPGRQPAFPNDSNTRGTALEYLVAQSLMYPYTEAPPAGSHSVAGQGLTPP